MSYFQSFSNCYDNNHEADDSSTVFDVDTVIPDKVPSLLAMPPLPTLTATATTAATATTDYLYNNNNVTISSSPHSSQNESPQSFTSEFLRRINSQRSLAMPSTTTATATTTATRGEEISRSNQHQCSSSSSSKKRPIITNSSVKRKQLQENSTSTTTKKSSTKRPRRSSCLKRQPQDQNCTDDKSESEVEDENELEDYEPDEAVINQSSSSFSSQTSTTKELTKYELRWKNKFEELCDYKRLHGHANVPKSNKQLGEWVNNQRREYKKLKENKHSCMTNKRIEMLESIDFEWVSPNRGTPRNESSWNKRFTELKEYKEKYGRTNVPYRWEDNKELGVWVSTQRVEYKKFKKNGKGKITPERVDLLNSIGFEWECRPARAPSS